MDLQQFENDSTRHITLFIAPYIRKETLSRVTIQSPFNKAFKTYVHQLNDVQQYGNEGGSFVAESCLQYLRDHVKVTSCSKRKRVIVHLVFLGKHNNESVMAHAARKLEILIEGSNDPRSAFLSVASGKQYNLKNPITLVLCKWHNLSNESGTIDITANTIGGDVVWHALYNVYNTEKKVQRVGLSTLDNVVRQLDIQANAAITTNKTFKPDSTHVVDLVMILRQQLTAANTIIEQQGKQINSLQTDVASLNDTIEQQDKRIELLCSDCTSLNDVVVSLSNTIEQQDKRIEELEMRMAAMEHKQQQADVVTEQLRIDNERIIRENEELRRGLVELHRENNQLKQKLNG